MLRGSWPVGGSEKKLAVAWLHSRAGGWTRAEYHCGHCREKRLYVDRNCNRHFPELVQIGRRPRWAPKFTVQIGDKKKLVTVSRFRTAECPTSLITGESIWLVEQVRTAMVMKEHGAVLFGPDASRHPAWWVDALEAVATANAAYDDAVEKARASN